MPVRAPRICACGKTVSGSSRCRCEEKRARERKARHDKVRPTARQRGYDREWDVAAKKFLALPQNEFCECGAPACVVRHIFSIKTRPDLRMVRSNWRPGCQRCNALDAARERQNQKGK